MDRAEEVSDESGDMVQEFAEKTKNEFHAQHIKVHYLSLHVLTKIALGKVSIHWRCCHSDCLRHLSSYISANAKISKRWQKVGVFFVCAPPSPCT